MSIAKLQASLAQATNEVTVAAANINFDFCLVKYEAPKEYRPLGELLSVKRKENAEHGKGHATARRLAALFEGVCPDTPRLIKAYGERVSEISKNATDNQNKSFSASMFGSYTGVDATSIWAAATSSQSTKSGAIHVHLLACMLASMFSASEATSIWVELIEERRRAIATGWDRNESVPFSVAAAAVQQAIPREQLAEWDASARAWIQTADSVMATKQTQLRLILENLNLAVASEGSVYPGVVTAWKSTLKTIERLISGVPQEVQDGSAIMGLRAWHIYPDIIVFGSRNVEVAMKDPLVSSGGVLSLGCSPSATTPSSGISWSLSLAHLKYYGHPVQRQGGFRPNPECISFEELLIVVLGCILTRWDVPTDSKSTRTAIRFIGLLSLSDSQNSEKDHKAKNVVKLPGDWDITGQIQGMQLLSQAANMFLKDEYGSMRLVNLGRNRPNFIPSLAEVHRSDRQIFVRQFFGLTSAAPLAACIENADSRVEFLRRMANKNRVIQGHKCIIQYACIDKEGKKYINYASVFPRLSSAGEDNIQPAKKATPSHSRWLDPKQPVMTIVGEDIHVNHEFSLYAPHYSGCVYQSGTAAKQVMELWYGDSSSAAIYIAKDQDSSYCVPPKITPEDILWCAEHGMLSLERILRQVSDSITWTLQCLAEISTHAFGTILGPVIPVKILENPLIHVKSIGNLGSAKSDKSSFTQAISILLYMVAAHDMLPDHVPATVIGISAGDSIFVPEQLLWDPMQTGARKSFTRILGNIGRPGCVMFFSVEKPMTSSLDRGFWRIGDPHQFDGTATDLFQSTSMHFSFTNWERPLEGFSLLGNQDVELTLMESVLSIRERGRWVGDVDVLPALRSKVIYRLPPQPTCSHDNHTEPPQTHMTSIESWHELREYSAGNVVVRANGNWLARLAVTSYLAQSAERKEHNIKRITICPSSVCWKCVDGYVAQFPANIYIY